MIAENISVLKKNQRHQSSKKRLILSKSINIESLFFDNILHTTDWFKKSKIVASFLSIKSEIPTVHLNQIIEKSGKVLCLPLMPKDDSGILTFKKYFYGDKLSVGSYGVKEPLSKNSYLPDIIFTPCLAFDIHGFRLGYGGGFYDKTISYLNFIKHDFLTIGLAYDDQRVNDVVHDDLDQKLNYILTEKQLYKIL
jgi:5-formyltetrahydrofolate cyclo-ligase